MPMPRLIRTGAAGVAALLAAGLGPTCWPRRCRSVIVSADFGGAIAGNRRENNATATHAAAPMKQEFVEASAPARLTIQHPTIQPNVPTARIGPNCRCESCNRASTIEVEMPHVGALQSA